MSDPSLDPPAPAAAAPLSTDDRSPAAPLFVWLVIQLIALSLGALCVPLAARVSLPAEQFAIHILLVTQVVSAAALFPFLLRDVTTSAMVILTTLPFIQLAGYLSRVPLSRAALAAMQLVIWLVLLSAWRVLFRTHRERLFSIAIALAYSLGSAMTWYAMAESRVPPVVHWPTDALYGPVLGVIAQLEAPAIASGSWFVALMVLLVVTSSAAIRSTRKRSQERSSMASPR